MKSIIKSVVLMSALLLAGCQPPKEPLRIVSSPWPGYEPLYLARDLGYLDKESVKINELPSSNITLEAFRNGSADIATLTFDEALTLAAEGRKLRVLAVMDISNGADAVMARPEIKSLADLKGKRIAIVNIPLGVYMLSRTLDAAGLKPADVTVIQMPEDKHEKAYVQGKIDAAITFEPFKSAMAKAGANLLFDSSKIPNEVFDLMLVREEVYQSRRDELCQLVGQWFRTLDYVRANQLDANTRMGKRLGLDPEAYRVMLSGLTMPSKEENMRLLGGSAPAILTPARRLEEIMRREHLLSKQVDPAAVLDPSFQACIP